MATARTRPSRLYALAGAALGTGAPLGLLALHWMRSGARTRRRGVGRWVKREFVKSWLTYDYMTLSTPLVFALFGSALGRIEEKRRTVAHEMQRLREEFVSIVAHDLRNPIQAMLLQVDALRRHADQPVPSEALVRLERGGERLSRMVDDLLDASRIEASRLSLERVPVDLVESVEALVDRIGPTLGSHRTDIEVEGEPPRVLADPGRLDQILTNLLENSAKYSAKGSPIQIVIQPDHGGVRLTVSDTGPGIDAPDLAHLFDRFYQTEHARRKQSGLGLGLYITKGLVEAHGGRIEARSTPGKGSTFSVWLPVAPGHPPPPPVRWDPQTHATT